MNFKLTLKQKNTIPHFFIMILVFVLGSLITVKQLNTLKLAMISRPMENAMEMLSGNVDFTAGQALEKAALFSRMPQVQKALALAHEGNIDDPLDPRGQQAREMLRRELQPVMAGYEAVTGEKMKLHFHLPNGRSLVRMWREKQIQINGKWQDRSDDISEFRHTVLDVHASGRPVRGIELGRGGFVIRGVAPVVDDAGKALGSVEVLQDFSLLMKTFFSSARYTVRLYMNKGLLSITHRLQDEKTYPHAGGRYVQITGEPIADTGRLKEVLLLMDKGRTGFNFQMDGRTAMAAFPIMDYKNTQIGVMLLETDASRQSALVRNIISVQVVVLLAVLCGMGIVSILFLQRTILTPIAAIIDRGPEPVPRGFAGQR